MRYTVYTEVLFTILLLAILGLTGCGEKVSTHKAAIIKVMTEAEQGWNEGNLEKYMECYRNSSKLRFAGEDHLSFGWHQVLENYRKAYSGKSKMGQLVFDDLDVQLLSEDSALVVGRWRLNRHNDQPHGVFTLVMTREKDGWKIMHDHTSSSDGTLDAAEASITERDLLERVAFLASDELAGRLPGTRGYRLAAEAAAQEFAELGFQPGGDNGYFQTLHVESNEVVGHPIFKLSSSSDSYQLGEDYVFRGFTGQGNVDAQVVFCGYGLSQPENGYDDYSGVDAEGKIVLVFKQAPSWKLENGDGWGHQHYPRPKAKNAADHGARAVLLVSKPNDKNPQPIIGSVMHGDGEQVGNVPVLQINLEVAADLLASTGYSLKDLQTQIDESKTPHSLQTHTQVKIDVATHYKKAAETWNVVGILPGSDPDLKTETFVLGAHLDHVGKQAQHALFPGANDNASGSAALMEIAEAFTRSPKPPKRTLVFVLFSAEEQGLFGSNYFVNNPVRPLNDTVAMFNFDCVAYGDSIRVYGGKSNPLLWGRALQLDALDQNLMTPVTGKGGGADATAFHEADLPTLYFVTTNGYTHLHRTTDTVETLNGPLFEAITRLGYRTAAWVASGDYQREWLLK